MSKRRIRKDFLLDSVVTDLCLVGFRVYTGVHIVKFPWIRDKLSMNIPRVVRLPLLPIYLFEFRML